MRDETVARNYADALFEVALRHGSLDGFGEGIGTVAALLDQERVFRRFVETPRIAADEKKRVLRRVFARALAPQVLNFVLLTIDKRRQRLIRQIAVQYDALVDEHFGRTHVEVSVARPLDDEALAELTATLSRRLGTTALPYVRVRPELLGGVVVRTGDTIYDGSLRRRLGDLRQRLLGAELPGPARTD